MGLRKGRKRHSELGGGGEEGTEHLFHPIVSLLRPYTIACRAQNKAGGKLSIPGDCHCPGDTPAKRE